MKGCIVFGNNTSQPNVDHVRITQRNKENPLVFIKKTTIPTQDLGKQIHA